MMCFLALLPGICIFSEASGLEEEGQGSSRAPNAAQHEMMRC
jgi:hypothetical protein